MTAPDSLRIGRSSWILLLAIAIAAFNLRPAVSSVGPIIDQITFTGISNAVGGGMLVSIPVLLFGLASPVLPMLARYGGLNLIVMASLALLGCAILARSFSGTFGLLLWTLVIGCAIAFVNVALPAVIRATEGIDRTILTGVYSAMLSAGAAVAAGATVPIAEAFSLDWRAALAIWAVPAFVAALIWLWFRNRERPQDRGEPRSLQYRTRKGGRWVVIAIAGFFGMQSMMYYSMLAWMPSMLQDRGVNALDAGNFLAIVNWFGIPASFLVPMLCRSHRAVPWVVGLSVTFWGVGLAFVFLTSQFLLGSIVVGLAQGSSLSLGLTMIVLASRSGRAAVGVSGAVQGIGYVIAAIGPVLMGMIMTRTGSWVGAEIGLLAVVALATVFGLSAASQLARSPAPRVE